MHNHFSDSSCAVATHIERNHATLVDYSATDTTTINATDDLLALSARVLERNSGNSPRNHSASLQLHRCTSNETSSDDKNELEYLILQVGIYYKATDLEIDQMFEDVLNHHSMEIGLTTFRILVERIKILSAKCRKFTGK